MFHSDLERTEPRLVLPQPASAPPPDFALPPLVDDDLDEPTETKQRPSAPRKSDTRATDPRVSWDSDIGSIADELEPTTCRVTDLTPLSATRVAVYPGISGRPEVVFLPAGQRPPPGAAVALIVPTSPEDAALLAAMVRVFEHGRAAS